jgi:CHAD domain-containing protein
MKKPWKDTLPLRDNLRRKMPKLAREFFAEGRTALADGTSWDLMHQFRLRAKRFRYTLEMFRPAYGRGLETRIDAVRKIQTLLGDINDCIVTTELLGNSAAVQKAQARLKRTADSKLEKLREFWAGSFDAEGQEQRWMNYLTRYVCLPARPPRIQTPSNPPENS